MADFARLQQQYDRASAILAPSLRGLPAEPFSNLAPSLRGLPAEPGGGVAVHFVGIAGVGMAGLATLLAQRGFRVSGCDAHPDAPTVPPLRALGVAVAEGHDPAHVAALDPARGDFVIRTPAADPESPELAAAAARGLAVLDRGPVLAALLNSLPNPLVAVCGTHGKTTTSTFTTQLLRALGVAPGWCIGAPGVAAAAPGDWSGGCGGADSSAPPFVAECDESDGSLALYRPAIAVIGSVDFDHAETFATEADFLAVFDALLSQTRLAVVYNADDAHLRAYVESRASSAAWRPLPVGTGPSARLRATALEETAAGTAFDLALDGAPLGRFLLPIPGRHNLLNALAAIAALVALQEGVRGALLPDRLPPALSSLHLPGRRFEEVSTADGVRVVADYAHHPAEIAACLAMARATLAPGGRLIAVFQPHRPSRTLALRDQFPAAFAEADALALAPVYAASEPDIPGGDIADLYAHFRAQSGESSAGNPCYPCHPCETGAPKAPCVPVLLRSLDEALPWLRRTVRSGDTVLLVGAGDIISLASSFGPGWTSPPPLPPTIDGVSLEPGASATSLCSYGVGGPVRALARVRTVEALRALLAWCRDTDTPWCVLGSGTNLLVPDTGFDGLLLRLEGDAFGAALPGARLLAEWQRLGYSGLECMDGIPGTIGGWLAMNAGAQGHAIGDCLVSLTLLDPADGTVRTLPRSALVLGYRTAAARSLSLTNPSVCDSGAEASVGHPCHPCYPCETTAAPSATPPTPLEHPCHPCYPCETSGALPAPLPLSQFVLLSAEFAPLERTTPEVVTERRAAFRAKRFDFRGLRTAGSVFRNPPGDSAGRLLDAAGLKGLRVGGAFVSDRHANIFCAGPGATASDLLALIRLARLRVPGLEPEVRIL